MKKKLHPVQARLLDLLQKHITDPLTIRQLQDEVTASSSSVVFHHLKQLEKKGFLRRNPQNSKDYVVLKDTPDAKIAYINLYGPGQCGPNGSLLDGAPIDRIPISTQILGFPSNDAFMLKARGLSMLPKIHDGDIVIAKKSRTANDGDIVVCTNDEEVLIKKIKKSTNEIILISLNNEFPPFVASENFFIEGVVKGVFTYDV